MAIDSGDYTAYGRTHAPKSAGVPWSDEAEARIATLEAQAVADDARIDKLDAHVKHLEAIIHKYINAGEPE